jgi:uncharacterized YigZ family protein
MTSEDSYHTINKASKPVLFKDKNSKFYAYAFPVINEDQVKHNLESLKKEHHSAGHYCYAYQIGTENSQHRTNDDGEPKNSAGMPIYGQIQSFDVTNTLIVVVRYFGGIKLGVSGLINAYRTAAQMALESVQIIEKTIDKKYTLKFNYNDMGKVRQLLKENQVNIVSQTLELNCLFEISVRKSNSLKVFEIFQQFYGVEISEL